MKILGSIWLIELPGYRHHQRMLVSVQRHRRPSRFRVLLEQQYQCPWLRAEQLAQQLARLWV
jgi:hypothetical protein